MRDPPPTDIPPPPPDQESANSLEANRYPTKVKVELVMELLRGKSLNTLARETGRPRKQLAAWRRRFLEGAEAYLSARDDLSELDRLRHVNRQLLCQIDQLTAETRRLLTRLMAAESGANPGIHPICSALYSEAFDDGETKPLFVPEWRTHVLLRQALRATAARHATGLQPHASLDPSCDLKGGLLRLKEDGLASITLITDPMWCPNVETLREAFDSCRPFKQNYLIDRMDRLHIRKRHRNMINNAKRICEVRQISLAENLDRWWELYQLNVQNRAIVQPFSRQYFEKLSGMAGLMAVASIVDEDIVTITLWLRFKEIAYYHDGASNEKGLTVSASYASFAYAIERLKDCRYLFLGGSADFRGEDGLAVFKRGFSNASTQSYLCSSILNRGQRVVTGIAMTDDDHRPSPPPPRTPGRQ